MLTYFMGGYSPEPTVDWSTYNGSNNIAGALLDSLGTGNYLLISRCIQLDDTTIMIVYTRNGTSGIKAIIGTRDNSGVWSWGSETTIDSTSGTTKANFDVISSTKVIVGYGISSTSVKAVICTISGTSITVGTPVTVASVNPSSFDIAICALSDTQAFINYGDDSTTNNSGKIAYLGLSGTTITVGSIIDSDPTTQALNSSSLVAISSTKAILISGLAGGIEVSARLITVSGTSPSIDNTLTIKNFAATIGWVSIRKIDSTRAVVFWNDTFANTTSYAVMVSESSGTLSKGTEITFGTNTGRVISSSVMDDSHIVVTYNIPSSTAVKSLVITYSGTTLTAGTIYDLGIAAYATGSVYGGKVGQQYYALLYNDNSTSTPHIMGLRP